jgi:hypothetical protein
VLYVFEFKVRVGETATRSRDDFPSLSHHIFNALILIGTTNSRLAALPRGPGTCSRLMIVSNVMHRMVYLMCVAMNVTRLG